MRIVQVNDNDLFGSRFNGYTLNQYARDRGHTADQLVWTKHSDDDTVHQLAANNPKRDLVKLTAHELNLTHDTHAFFDPFGYELPLHRVVQRADIVNLHLVHNFFMSVLHLPILTRLKPTVWTLHDPWAMTGHCVHPFGCERWKTGCGKCPLLNVAFAIENDATALNWEVKRQTYAQCDLDLIVGSDWMLNRVKQSPLLERFRVHKVPFGVDTDVYKPADATAAKRALGIDPATTVVAMRSIPGEFKGLDTLKAALHKLESDGPVTLLTFNEKGLLDELRKRFKIVELGWVHGDDNMARAYHAADVFLMPSTAESFGMMAMEAMACGVPCLVTEGTALPDTVMPARGGGVAVPHDADAIARELTRLVNDPESRRAIGDAARSLAVEHYRIERYVDQTLAVYDEVIARRAATDDGRARTILEDLAPFAKGDRPSQPTPDTAPTTATDTDEPSRVTPPSPQPPPPPGLAPDPQPDSLILMIKVHDRLRSSRKLTAIWRRFLKPVVARAMRTRNAMRAKRHAG